MELDSVAFGDFLLARPGIRSASYLGEKKWILFFISAFCSFNPTGFAILNSGLLPSECERTATLATEGDSTFTSNCRYRVRGRGISVSAFDLSSPCLSIMRSPSSVFSLRNYRGTPTIRPGPPLTKAPKSDCPVYTWTSVILDKN